MHRLLCNFGPLTIQVLNPLMPLLGVTDSLFLAVGRDHSYPARGRVWKGPASPLPCQTQQEMQMPNFIVGCEHKTF